MLRSLISALPLVGLLGVSGIAHGALLVKYDFELPAPPMSPDVPDKSGNGRDTAFQGVAGYNADPRFGTYNGATLGGFLPVPAFDYTDSFTLFVFVKLTDAPNIQTIFATRTVGFNDANDAGFALYVNNGGSGTDRNVVFNTSAFSGGLTELNIETGIGALPADGNYHSLAVTVAGGSANIYVDGNLAGSGATVGGFPTNKDGTVGVFPGGFAFTSLNFDQFLVFDEALSGEQIRQLDATGDLTAIPEPASLAVTAAAGLLIARRRR